MTTRETQLEVLQGKLGYKFKNPALLESALTHSSYANEAKERSVRSNERLEFLGDSVLGLTVSAFIYDNYPDMHEGRMTRLRSELVCEKSLAAIAAALSLGDCLLLGHGEEKGGGRNRPSILADAVEAVFAAVYIDGGFSGVSTVITNHLVSRVDISQDKSSDYKTALQEVVQEKSGQALGYSTIDESGPDHMKLFTVEVRLNGVNIGRGTGKSKKEAEQQAAKAALDKLGESAQVVHGKT